MTPQGFPPHAGQHREVDFVPTSPATKRDVAPDSPRLVGTAQGTIVEVREEVPDPALASRAPVGDVKLVCRVRKTRSKKLGDLEKQNAVRGRQEGGRARWDPDPRRRTDLRTVADLASMKNVSASPRSSRHSKSSNTTSPSVPSITDRQTHRGSHLYRLHRLLLARDGQHARSCAPGLTPRAVLEVRNHAHFTVANLTLLYKAERPVLALGTFRTKFKTCRGHHTRRPVGGLLAEGNFTRRRSTHRSHCRPATCREVDFQSCYGMSPDSRRGTALSLKARS